MQQMHGEERLIFLFLFRGAEDSLLPVFQYLDLIKKKIYEDTIFNEDEVLHIIIKKIRERLRLVKIQYYDF